MKKRWMALLLGLLMLGSCVALADGAGEWYYSRNNGYVQMASYVGDYPGWIDASGMGGVSLSDQYSVRVISRNASVWSQPRTNSTKLGSVKNGEELQGIVDSSNDGYGVLQFDGFYAVEYKGKTGWINSAYSVSAPFEIVLMESNVPAYCAPTTQAKRVGSLNKLTRYTVMGFYDDFYVVNLREAAAYIPMSVSHYDTTFERLYHGGMRSTLITTRKTAIRTGPGDNYAKVKDVNANQRFICLDEIDGWYLIADGGDGFTYISASDANVQYGM